MKITKRLLSFCLIVVLCLSVCAPVSAEETFSYFLLRPENFTLPELWTVQKDTNKYSPALPGNYLKSSKSGPAAETSVYITEEGDYAIWVMVLDYNNAEFGKRNARVSVDGTIDEQAFGSTIKDGFTWSRSKNVYRLTPGLHTIGVSVGYPSTCFSAVFVTNDLSFTLDENTLYTDIEQYSDTSKPTFSGEIVAERDSVSSFTVTFPTAEDNIGIAGYGYFLNDEPISVDETNSYRAEGLMPLKSYTVKVTAYDSLGNTTVLEEDINLFDWRLLDAKLTDSTDLEIENLSQLIGGQTSVKVAFEFEKLIGGLKRPFLFAGIYTKDEKRMVSYNLSRWNAVGAAGAVVSKSVELTLPQEVMDNPADYIVKATMVESDTDLIPLISGVTIGEAVASE